MTDHSATVQALSRIDPSKTVCIVGSGLSLTDGVYPSWVDLVRGLCAACEVDLSHHDLLGAEELMDAAEECKTRRPDAYYSFLYNTFSTEKSIPPVYIRLSSIGFYQYITTNYDYCLSEVMKNAGVLEAFYTYPILPRDSNSGRLYHIHGIVRRSHSGYVRSDIENRVVLSRSDFRDAYGESGPCGHLVVTTMGYYDCLFLGCELREPDLAGILKSTRALRERNAGYVDVVPSLTILLPHRHQRADPAVDMSGQVEESRLAAEDTENDYYSSLGIDVIRYDPVDSRYTGLVDVLSEWGRFERPRVATGPWVELGSAGYE